MRMAICILGLVGLAATARGQEGCPFDRWVAYRGVTLWRHTTGAAYAYKATHTALDADGAPNAYHPDDVGRPCRGDGPFKGLDCPGNAGYPRHSWWRQVLVPDPRDRRRAFVQQTGEYAGYFVSQTSLTDTSRAETDPARYVDAATVPYVVFPGSFYTLKGTGHLGDLGSAVNLQTGARSPFVVADAGPADAGLGEISIALARALGGTEPDARTAAGAPTGPILFVVFPGSARSPRWPLTADELERGTADLLARIGGIQTVMAWKEAF